MARHESTDANSDKGIVNIPIVANNFAVAVM